MRILILLLTLCLVPVLGFSEDKLSIKDLTLKELEDSKKYGGIPKDSVSSTILTIPFDSGDSSGINKINVLRIGNPDLLVSVPKLNLPNIDTLKNGVVIEDKETSELRKSYLKKQIKYTDQLMEKNLAVLEWQLFASNIILWMVVALVFSGILFSAYQLIKGASTKDFGENTAEFDSQKIKVTSSVVGIVVLTISLTFFYLFIKEVYNIKVLDYIPTETKEK
ncbi:hypothetical protein [Acinetobacter modestus]|uniref:hypothetical protein n=1 Tax=Acinetobacter modestus TaxID=1776740 RepID=UPI00301B1328